MSPGAWRPAIACAACGVAATLIVTIALALGPSTPAPMRCATDPAAAWVRACVDASPADDTWILQDEHGPARSFGTTLRRAVPRRRSLYPSCGYRLVHDGPCPECGSAPVAGGG